MLIEFNPERSHHKMLRDFIGINGFTEKNVFNEMENHSRVRRKKEEIKAENIVFTRS
jgi:hypothetical protein